MFSDSESVVRVTRYYKTIASRDPNTGLPVQHEVALDWGIGEVDYGRNGVYILGSPFQLFSDAHGDPTVDTRVLVTRERMALSTLPDNDDPLSTDTVHFKHPNI